MEASVIEKLVAQAGVFEELDFEDFSKKISAWAKKYSRDLADCEKEPTPKNIEKELDSLKVAIENVSTILNGLSANARVTLWGALNESVVGETNGIEDYADGATRYQVMREVLELLSLAATSGASRWAARKLGPQKKTKRISLRTEAVFELAAMWQDFACKTPALGSHQEPYGPFYDFVVTALEPVFGGTEARSGIYHTIRYVSSHEWTKSRLKSR